jgi:hypothetical protein
MDSSPLPLEPDVKTVEDFVMDTYEAAWTSQRASLNSFHEKAGVSQDGFVFTYVDSLPSSRAASVAILPSAVFYERFSLAARWASSIQ